MDRSRKYEIGLPEGMKLVLQPGAEKPVLMIVFQSGKTVQFEYHAGSDPSKIQCDTALTRVTTPPTGKFINAVTDPDGPGSLSYESDDSGGSQHS